MINSAFGPHKACTDPESFVRGGPTLTLFFMPPKELWEAYSNHTVRPSRFVSGRYLLYSLR